MNPRLLGVLAGSAVVIGVVLYLFLSSSSSATEPSETAPQPARPAATGDHAAPRMPTLDHPGSGTQLATTDVPRATGSDAPVPSYEVGGIKVRDHRAGSNKPLDVPPNPHPANARMLPSALTTDISQKVRQEFFACGASVPKEARGAKPKLEGQLTTSIKDHQLSVTGFVAQIRDVDAPYQDQLKSCIEQKALGLTASAGTEADIADYGIGVTFALP